MRYNAVKYAWSMIGKPYIWGGDDPLKGFDCSGFVIEILKGAGLLPEQGDWTAQGLYNLFNSDYQTLVTGGALVFYGKSNKKIKHVMFCIDHECCIGATGGGSKTETIKDAIDQNAFIKIRPIDYRKDVIGFIDVFSPIKYKEY